MKKIILFTLLLFNGCTPLLNAYLDTLSQQQCATIQSMQSYNLQTQQQVNTINLQNQIQNTQLQQQYMGR